jgi:hypothetical protein
MSFGFWLLFHLIESVHLRIFVSGTHSVHGYRSQHLQLNGKIGEQYLPV